MDETSVIQNKIDIAQELSDKNYEKLIGYADEIQKEVIHHWQTKDNRALEGLILKSRNILNFWTDSIIKKRLWVALVRCGAWIGTLETIEKSLCEESMDLWSQKRLYKNISSIKHLTEIIRLLEVKGVMTHSEMVEELHLRHASTLTEIMKKVAELELVDVRRAGKYNLYSLTDAGVRYARQMRAGEDRQNLLKKIKSEYGIRRSEASLDSYLQSADEGMSVKPGQALKIKLDDTRPQNVKVEAMMKEISYDEEIEYISFTTKAAKEKKFVYEAGA